MNQLEELREKLKQELQTSLEKFQESDLYNKIRERYLGLNPRSQKWVKFGALGALALFVFSRPISQFFEAGQYLQRAEELKLLQKDLVKVEREKLGLPSFEGSSDLQGVRDQMDQKLQTLKLLPSQIRALVTKAPEVIPAMTFSSEASFSRNQILGVIEVSLAQLNLRQVVEIGQSLEQISNLIVFKDLAMTPHTQEGYFDVLFHYLVLKPPATPSPLPEPIKPRGVGAKSGGNTNGSGASTESTGRAFPPGPTPGPNRGGINR
jgi:type II secretory pathway component PulM